MSAGFSLFILRYFVFVNQIMRHALESVIVESKVKIEVVFAGGLEIAQTM